MNNCEYCEYCDDSKLNLLIESEKISNMVYFFVNRDLKGKKISKDDIFMDDNSLVLDVRSNCAYLRLGDRSDMGCLDHSDKKRINYCPICGRDFNE